MGIWIFLGSFNNYSLQKPVDTENQNCYKYRAFGMKDARRNSSLKKEKRRDLKRVKKVQFLTVSFFKSEAG